MQRILLNNVTKFKLQGDDLFALYDLTWFKVNSFTFDLDGGVLPTILKDSTVDKGDNGLKIALSGRIKGVRMARKFQDHVGVGLRTQSIAWAIEEEKRQIFTKWGTIGLKVSRGGGKER